MSKIIPIGTGEKGAFAFPLDAATQTFAFIARRGAGKSYAAGKLVEGFAAAEIQFIILDSVGNWYGLRIAANGKDKGIDVPVIGGLRGDIPLNPGAGALIADIAVDSGKSLVLDVSQFSKADRQKFATALGQRLWNRKKGEESPTPIHLVIEESQLIVPEQVSKDQTTMIGIYEEIIRLGRNYGIGCTLITQRPQSVNKEVLNQTECLFVLQVNGAHEREAIKKWILHQGLAPAMVNELPSLPQGTAWVWSPQWLQILEKVKIGKKWTYDSTATPKPGQVRTGGKIKPINLDDLQAKMVDAVREAGANDPKLLRAEIARLKAEAKKAPASKGTATGIDPATVNKAIDAAVAARDKFWKGEIATLRQGARELKTMPRVLADMAGIIEKSCATILGSGEAMPPPLNQTPRFDRITKPATPVERTRPRPAESNGHTSALPIGERRILEALIQFPDGRKRDQLTVLTGYKRSTRNTYVQRLQERGYVVSHGEHVVATEEGTAALPDAQPLPTGAELQEFWMGQLPEGERAILGVLIETHPDGIDREALSERTGYKRSTRNTYLQRMSTKDLIVTEGDRVRASDNLF